MQSWGENLPHLGSWSVVCGSDHRFSQGRRYSLVGRKVLPACVSSSIISGSTKGVRMFSISLERRESHPNTGNNSQSIFPPLPTPLPDSLLRKHWSKRSKNNLKSKPLFQVHKKDQKQRQGRRGGCGPNIRASERREESSDRAIKGLWHPRNN